MSCSTQAVLPFAPRPKPIPRVDIAAKPPEGMRWLGIGEHFEATDVWIERLTSWLGPEIAGNPVRQRDIGKFLRWVVKPAEMSLMEKILQKKKK